LAFTSPHRPRCGSSRFYPPVCYQLSLAGTSSLLRIHLPPHTASFSLESPLAPPYPFRLIPLGTMQGFPSYFGLPVSCSTLNHVTGLIRYWASRLFARLPSRDAVSGLPVGRQVRFRCVPLTSYRFLQTLPLPATPLRFRLSSP
jgi:hypothetical protein